MNHPIHTTSTARRHFLRGLGSSAALMAAPWAPQASAAGGDYRALVCIFLGGGNDALNTVLATDRDSWAGYNAARNSPTGSVALLEPGARKASGAAPGSPEALGGILPLTPKTVQGGRTFAVHPLLAGTRGLFDQGRLAVLANVGVLLQPTTRADLLARRFMPPRLGSHNDQQSIWQSFSPEGATLGWGGAMLDRFAASNGAGADFSAISVAGNTVWLGAQNVTPYVLTSSGPVQVANGRTGLYGSKLAMARLKDVLQTGRSDMLEQDQISLTQRSILKGDRLAGMLPRVGAGGVLAAPTYISPLSGKSTDNPLAQQLELVARMVAARQAIGVGRQNFYVSLPGFDTHSGQNQRHAELMAALDSALVYFNAALSALPGGDASGMVTTFTASEFGRSLVNNSGGTDHGWGGHHLVMGGAVKGGDLYGQMPKTWLDSDDDSGHGRFIPTTSVDQYAATLATWFGVPDSALNATFPNLRNFPTSERILPFLKA